jgi:hypothetical protein
MYSLPDPAQDPFIWITCVHSRRPPPPPDRQNLFLGLDHPTPTAKQDPFIWKLPPYSALHPHPLQDPFIAANRLTRPIEGPSLYNTSIEVDHTLFNAKQGFRRLGEYTANKHKKKIKILVGNRESDCLEGLYIHRIILKTIDQFLSKQYQFKAIKWVSLTNYCKRLQATPPFPFPLKQASKPDPPAFRQHPINL